MGVVIVPIVGHPVSQAASPALFNPRFSDRGIDAVMVGVDLLPDLAPGFIQALRDWRDTPGCIVTMPFKTVFAGLVDRRSARAELLGAVNVIRREPGGSLYGDMLDGDGCLGAAASHGFIPAGRRAWVIGAGGAGSAIALALRDGGVASLHVTDSDPHRAWELAKRLGPPALVGVPDPGSLDFLVNATSAGMDCATLPATMELLGGLPGHCLVAELVTQPATTPLLRAALQLGLTVQTGVETAAAQTETFGRILGLWR